MSFSTNKYTRPVLVSHLKSINARKYSSFESFVSSFSPRAGVKSAKIAALTKALSINTASLQAYFSAGVSTTTVKKILISNLK